MTQVSLQIKQTGLYIKTGKHSHVLPPYPSSSPLSFSLK